MKLIYPFILCLSLLCMDLTGGIEDYFKPCSGKNRKGRTHSMRNIDFIYTINLDQRPEKFASCTKQLHPYGIYPYRFSAVNGWELSLETIDLLGVKFEPGMDATVMGTSFLIEEGGQLLHDYVHVPGRTYYCHCMARGPIGIVLSHLSVLQDAYDSGYETIWVMEDDIHVVRDPHEISELIDKLDALVGKKNWDVLFTDPDTKNNNGENVPCLSYAKRPNFTPANPERFARREWISSDFKKIGARYGAYSMVVRKSGMKKILDFIKCYSIFLPYDMEFQFPEDIRLYALNYDLVTTQINALSDNGAPNYQNKNH